MREVLGSNHRSDHILFPHLWHLVAQCGSMFGSEQQKDCVPSHCSCEPISLPNIPPETQSTCEMVSKAYETITLKWGTLPGLLRPVTQQTPGRYLCCKSICTNIIFSGWEKTETQCSVLVDTKVLYPTTLSTLFGKQFLLRLTDLYSHFPKRQIQFLAVFNHTKATYKQADIVFHVYVLGHRLNVLTDTGCMKSKLTVSKPSVLVWFILFFFYFLKVILCENKGHCLELIIAYLFTLLYYGLMMDGWVRVLRFFQQYFRHFGRMEGWTWKDMCNEAPFRIGKNLACCGIRTRGPVIRSWEC